jgi:thioredoxin reductase
VSRTSLDVLVIGGGPAGLSGALILARCCRRVAVVDDARPRNGATAAVHGYLTRDGSSPDNLRRVARQELARYGVKFYQGHVTSLRRSRPVNGKPGRSCFLASLTDGLTLQARKILIATGVLDQFPSLPGLAECFGITVHHCPYCDGWESRGQRVAILGKTAQDCVGLALAVRTWTREIVVLTNGRSLSREQALRLTENRIGFRECPVTTLVHQKGRLQRIEFDNGSQEECSRCFIDFGQQARSQLISGLADKKPCSTVEVDEKQRTDVSGLFVAGDVTGGVQMIAVAISEGATAAVAINRELQDEDEAIRRQEYRNQSSAELGTNVAGRLST